MTNSLNIFEADGVRCNVNVHTAQITIDKPATLNALAVPILKGLLKTFDMLEEQKKLRVVTLRGAGGKAFVAGADVKTMATLENDALADYLQLGQRVMRRIEKFRTPVIAAVTGYALGGGLELALACDMIVATEVSRFGQPEINLGVIPGFGGTQRLAGRVGWGVAKSMVFTGDTIKASDAFAIRLVDKVWPEESFETQLNELIAVLVSKPPLALSAAKKVITETRESWELAGLQREVESFILLTKTKDCREGFAAFVEKRLPLITGE
jgi:enoyl-CoA hydratase